MGPIELLQRTLKMVKENLFISMFIQLFPIQFSLLLHMTLPVPLFIFHHGMDHRWRTFNGFLLISMMISYSTLFAVNVYLNRAFFYTVANLYNGKTIKPNEIKEISRAQPSSWKGFAITQLWGALSNLTVIIVLGSVFFRFSLSKNREQKLYFAELSKLLFLVCIIVLVPYYCFQSTLLQMAYGACLEGCYGLAAIKKGWSLLKGRWTVALGLCAVLDLPQLVVLGSLIVVAEAPWELLEGMKIAAKLLRCEQIIPSWLMGIILVMAYSGIVQISVMTRALFYISCKAYHQESFDITSQIQQAAAYEPIGKSKLANFSLVQYLGSISIPPTMIISF